jgi:hypothetical protein
MPESRLWQRLNQAFGLEGDWVRVENPARPGTPDVNFAWLPPGEREAVREGWIELKQMPSFPKKYESAIFRIPHYTPQQRVWIRRRSRAGGHVWVLLHVEKPCTYILLPGPFCGVLGDVPAPTLERHAVVWSQGKFFPKAQIAEELRRGSLYLRHPSDLRPGATGVDHTEG